MRLLDLSDLERGPGHALLEATVAMGFSEPVARAGLAAELSAWTTPGALDAVRAELPADLNPARRPESVLVIGARTLPASLMRAVLMARLLEARVIIKPASGHDAVADAIASADAMVSVSSFASSDAVSTQHAIDAVESVVVLGSDETVASVASRVPPSKSFVGYGHRLSVAWLDRVDDEVLTGLAYDLCAWDQAGCLSPQVVWVSEDPAQVASRLAEVVSRVESELPMALPTSAAPARTRAKTYAEMVGTCIATETALIGVLPTSEFRVSPGYRCLWVLPAASEALVRIAPHLSTVGVSGDVPAGISHPVRVCDLGAMQRPHLTWQHDGRPNLTPMLRPDGAPQRARKLPT